MYKRQCIKDNSAVPGKIMASRLDSYIGQYGHIRELKRSKIMLWVIPRKRNRLLFSRSENVSKFSPVKSNSIFFVRERVHIFELISNGVCRYSCKHFFQHYFFRQQSGIIYERRSGNQTPKTALRFQQEQRFFDAIKTTHETINTPTGIKCNFNTAFINQARRNLTLNIHLHGTEQMTPFPSLHSYAQSPLATHSPPGSIQWSTPIRYIF